MPAIWPLKFHYCELLLLHGSLGQRQDKLKILHETGRCYSAPYLKYRDLEGLIEQANSRKSPEKRYKQNQNLSLIRVNKCSMYLYYVLYVLYMYVL